jgi:predicted nucleic acid-binding protein
VILADTSAWIEYLRRTESPVDLRLDAIIRDGERVGTTDVVVMEVLAGARDNDDRDRLRRLLYRFDFLPVGGVTAFEAAAELARECRAAGEPVRGLVDCLVAVVAIRDGASVLHRDRDFETMARYSALRLEPVAA